MRILIVGGGIIGLSLGRALCREGQEVVIFDKGRAGRATSWKAAGMLAPSAELWFEEEELYHFGRECMARWPQFTRELEEETGIPLDYRREGTLVVADDRDSAEALRRVYEYQQRMDVNVSWLTRDEALALEPLLTHRIVAAVYSPDDHQVDNQQVVEALRTSVIQHGATLLEETPVARIIPSEPFPELVTAEGATFRGDVIVVAAGVWSAHIQGIPEELRPPLRPVKGQMVQLHMESPFTLRHVIRGPQAYLAPKSNGRLPIGATSEEMGFDTTVTAGGVYTLLEGAWEIVPAIYDLPFDDAWAGLRPASRDHRPILGKTGLPGVLYATGHYRHGILHAPYTAELLTRLILENETSEWLERFSPYRFYPEETT